MRPIVHVRGRQILRQDGRALALQTRTITSFGGEHFTSTDLDVLGNAIWHLLRRAERAETQAGSDVDDSEPVDRTVTFEV